MEHLHGLFCIIGPRLPIALFQLHDCGPDPDMFREIDIHDVLNSLCFYYFIFIALSAYISCFLNSSDFEN